MPKRIYMDYAAATPLDKTVASAMQPYLINRFYNPSSLYTPARQIRDEVEAARSRVAKILVAKPSEVIFTAGATESINLSITGIAKAHPGSNIVISAVEHEAVMAAAISAFGDNLKICPVTSTGLINLDQLSKLVDEKTVLVSVMYANNEIGTIQPLARIAQVVNSVRKLRKSKLPLYFHTDASQAPNYLDLSVNRLGVDLMSLNGGKIYGPKQTGCLYIKSGVTLEPMLLGGGQERGLRSGTENVAGLVGFAQALEISQKKRVKESSRLVILRDRLISKLLKIEGVVLNGGVKLRLPNNVNISIKDVNGETLLHYLDHAGIMAATGAACSANKDSMSATLLSIGLSKAQANCSLRLSLGRQSSQADVDIAAKTIAALVDRLRTQSRLY